MFVHPNFDPVALQLGPISIHWYGLMYVFGFLGVYLYGSYRIKKTASLSKRGWTDERVSDLIFYGALGAVLGGRLGYVLFYKPAEYLADPLQIIYINQGGMSFHGGLLGVIFAMVLFARKEKFGFFEVADFVAPLVPIGLFFGRCGNFINQELWGKATDLPWGMVFTNGGPMPRHPSMLYEAVLEGPVLLLVLAWVARKPRHSGMIAGTFLCGYAIARILVEFVRVPDVHLNYILLNWVTMGHLLSLPMIVYGLYLIFNKRKPSSS